jgi:DASS family divalent anion:Na+ symporter
MPDDSPLRPSAAAGVAGWRGIAPLAAGAAVWLLPHPAFGASSWGLLSLFAATICALITRPLGAAPVVLVAITTAVLLRILTVQEALAGFGNVTVWLIVIAFMFARGLVQTRLGERIAYTAVRYCGGSPLRLGYAIVLADLAMAPMTASNTARAGGILFPVALTTARAFGSEPGPTAARIGTFLMKTLYQGDLVVSAMFLTATAPNPLVAELARQESGVSVTWLTWAAAAAVPGLAGLVLVPLVVYWLFPPTVRDTRAAQELAADRLRAMGRMSARERTMLAIFVLVLLLWVTAGWHGTSATTVAWLGLSLMLVTRVLEWTDILDVQGAWDVLIWFGGLMMLAGQLNEAGLTDAFAGAAADSVAGWPWWWALAALIVAYVYSHYAFATLVAHVTAMFPPFFAVAIGLGAPPLLTALAFGFFSSLNAATTHYGTGPAPIVFSAGYLTQAQWWRAGFVISVLHLAIWLPLGFLWWKILGLW